MEKSMGGSNKELSKLCLAGFILTIMPVLLLPLCLIFPREYGVVAALAIILLMPLTGLIVSIVGLITAGRKGKTGKGFGIAGVVLPSLAVTVIALILGPFFIGNARTATRLAENEMYPLGYMLEPTNTEYDVSPYRIPGEYVFYSNDLSVSENEFEAYAESKLQTIDNKTELSIRGTFQDYNFLIVRSDMREKWLEEKHKIDNLFVVHIGVKSSGTTYAKETIICKRKKDSYDHFWYTDIFSNNSYRLSSDYRSNVGDTVAFNPVSLISVFKPSEFKDKLLQNGHATKKELIAIYNALNNENGYVMTIEKLKLDEPQELVIMNKKKYTTPPTYKRDKELEQLMISLAMNKKVLLVTGDKKTGKTSLIDQLAYLIQHNQTPDFLKRQPIYEINIARLKMNKKTKNLEDKIKEIIDYAKSKEAILFLDDADEILETNQIVE